MLKELENLDDAVSCAGGTQIETQYTERMYRRFNHLPGWD